MSGVIVALATAAMLIGALSVLGRLLVTFLAKQRGGPIGRFCWLGACTLMALWPVSAACVLLLAVAVAEFRFQLFSERLGPIVGIGFALAILATLVGYLFTKFVPAYWASIASSLDGALPDGGHCREVFFENRLLLSDPQPENRRNALKRLLDACKDAS